MDRKSKEKTCKIKAVIYTILFVIAVLLFVVGISFWPKLIYIPVGGLVGVLVYFAIKLTVYNPIRDYLYRKYGLYEKENEEDSFWEYI